MTKADYSSSSDLALRIRLETCKMILHRGFGHLGGALSIVETLAVLYGKVMRYDPAHPQAKDRDYFVLSKGHAGPAYYATLALQGFFPLELLQTLNDDGTTLPSHPDRLKTPGVDVTTGSLGQGVSLAVGLAKALQLDGKPNRVFCLIGDGECNEGQVWEAFQFAAAHKLSQLYFFIDENRKQLDGTTAQILDPFDLRRKAEAFGLDAQRVDGKSETAIAQALELAAGRQAQAHLIVLDTIKGQGVPFIEAMADNHHIRFDADAQEQLQLSLAELAAELQRRAEHGR